MVWDGGNLNNGSKITVANLIGVWVMQVVTNH